MTTISLKGGGEALLVGPLVEKLFCGIPKLLYKMSQDFLDKQYVKKYDIGFCVLYMYEFKHICLIFFCNFQKVAFV